MTLRGGLPCLTILLRKCLFMLDFLQAQLFLRDHLPSNPRWGQLRRRSHHDRPETRIHLATSPRVEPPTGPPPMSRPQSRQGLGGLGTWFEPSLCRPRSSRPHWRLPKPERPEPSGPSLSPDGASRTYPRLPPV